VLDPGTASLEQAFLDHKACPYESILRLVLLHIGAFGGDH